MSSSELNQARIESVQVGGPGAGKLSIVAGVMVAVGLLSCLAALLSESGRETFGFAYLWGFTFLWTVVLGCLFFVGLHHVTGAVWSVVVRRVAEMFAGSMWLVGLLFIPILVFCLSGKVDMYHWLHPGDDPILAKKAGYLNVWFFAIRGMAFLGLWTLFAWFFVGRSLGQDEQPGNEGVTRKLRRVSAPFIPIFALTMTFASFDWLMSLDPHWYSTIYGAYVFSGMVCVSLSVISIGVIWLRAQGRLGKGIVTDEHLYSLGGLLFAFCCFWAYLWFSQYMLIWYGNLAEEVSFFEKRGMGPQWELSGWGGVSFLVILLRFVFPFFLLLSRDAKMNPRRLIVVSILVIFAEFVDLYWLIMPEVYHGRPELGWVEIGPALLMVGLLLMYVSWFVKKHRLVAVGDPLFEKSCHFHL